MKNIAILGLSSFGFYLCKSLHSHGHNLMAIDMDEAMVNKVKPFVRKAVIGNAKDKDYLISLGITDFDIAVISVGDQIDTSILITLYMKELKIKEIIAKAVNEDHAKILERVGATQIVFPERDMAHRMSYTIASPNFLDYIRLTEGFNLIEFTPPSKWYGIKLKDLNLKSQYNIQVVMVREMVPERMKIPDGEFVMKDSDILYIIGDDQGIGAVQKNIEK